MTHTRLQDVLNRKDIGDKWFSLKAPEEIRFWHIDQQWDNDIFRRRNVQVQAVYVKASAAAGSETKETYDKRNPMILSCGVDVTRGYFSQTQSKSIGFSLRITDVKEINAALAELASKFGFGQFEIRSIEIYNPKEGITTEFKVHNPNCEGDDLHTWRFINGDGSKLYPDAGLEFQKRAVCNFYEEMTHCAWHEKMEKKKVCGKKLKIRGKQIRLRKAT